MCYSSQLALEIDDTVVDQPEIPQANETVARQLELWKANDSFDDIYFVSAFARPMWPIITAEEPDQVNLLRWGLVPSWAKDANAFLSKAMTYNAKSETVHEKPSFRNAMKKGRRCLIPSTGFFEWHHLGKQKFPHFIRVRSSRIFTMAGIYENGTYSVLTTAANPLMEHIHNSKKRMPVILTEQEGSSWLRAELTKEEVKDLCKPYPADDMEAWPISKGVTSRSENPNRPDIHRRVEYPELLGADDGKLPL